MYHACWHVVLCSSKLPSQMLMDCWSVLCYIVLVCGSVVSTAHRWGSLRDLASSFMYSILSQEAGGRVTLAPSSSFIFLLCPHLSLLFSSSLYSFVFLLCLFLFYPNFCSFSCFPFSLRFSTSVSISIVFLFLYPYTYINFFFYFILLHSRLRSRIIVWIQTNTTDNGHFNQTGICY